MLSLKKNSSKTSTSSASHERKVDLYTKKLSSRSESNRKKALFRLLTLDLNFLVAHSNFSEHLIKAGNYIFFASNNTKEQFNDFCENTQKQIFDYDPKKFHCGIFSLKASKERKSKPTFIHKISWREIKKNEFFLLLEDPQEFIYWRKITIKLTPEKRFFFKVKKRKKEIKSGQTQGKAGNFTSIENLNLADGDYSRKIQKSRKRSKNRKKIRVNFLGKNVNSSLQTQKYKDSFVFEQKYKQRGREENLKKKSGYNLTPLLKRKAKFGNRRRVAKRRKFNFSISLELRNPRGENNNRVSSFDRAVSLYKKRRKDEERIDNEREMAKRVRQIQKLHWFF